MSKLKTNINKFEDLIQLGISGEDERFEPDDPNIPHCEKCKQSGRWDKWLEEQMEDTDHAPKDIIVDVFNDFDLKAE